MLISQIINSPLMRETEKYTNILVPVVLLIVIVFFAGVQIRKWWKGKRKMKARDIIKSCVSDLTFNICNDKGAYLIKELTKHDLTKCDLLSDNTLSTILDKKVYAWGIHNGIDDPAMKGQIILYVREITMTDKQKERTA